MRILYITDYLPFPMISGDRIRNYNLIRRIARQHQVWLAAPLIKPDQAEGILHLQEFCCGVETAPLQKRSKPTRLLAMLRYGLAGRPWEFEWLYSEELANKIRQLASTITFDIVQIEHSRMAPYLETLPSSTRAKRILVFHNIASLQYKRIAHVAETRTEKIRAWLHGRILRWWEPRYAERFDRCITMSEVDRRLLLKANSRLQASVIPNGVDTQAYRPLPLGSLPPALLFIGSMDYPPCADAAIYLCHQILPHIQRLLGQVKVWLVGRDPSPKVNRLNNNGVHVTGQVVDVVPYYRRSAVCVVPLRAGGGTRLKILEAMALGRPVVSTTIGCEGLDVVDGQHLLIADDPVQFAEKTVRLLTDKALYHRIANEARQLVVQKYDWDAIAEQLLDIYSEVTPQVVLHNEGLRM